MLALQYLLAAAAATGALAVPAQYHRASGTNGTISTNGRQFASQYDYIVAGGGLAGLVVASRLSEDADVQVAVIEAGPSGEGDANLTTPAANLYSSSVGTDLDWAYKTSPQHGLNGRQATWPRGKVLGGSSAINGLYMIRPNQIEVDAWADLVNTTTAKSKWGWDNLVKYMKKSETFTPPRHSIVSTLNSEAGQGANVLQYNADSRGSQGPIHVTWPGEQYANCGAYVQAVNNLGVPLNADPYGGNNTGPFVCTSEINPSNWTRSFSRTGYLDPVLGARPNLHVLVGYQVTKIHFDTSNATSAVATGVSYSAGDGQATYTANATNEVIVTAGAIGSPQLLQLSGVGRKSDLQSAGVQQVIDLPGVGYNLQDHLSTSITYAPANGVTIPPSKITNDPVTDSYVNDATAYLDINTVLGGAQPAQSFLSSLKSSISNSVSSYQAPPTVQAGYRAVLNTMAGLLPSVGPIEVLLADTYGSIQLQVALQHPVSRGSVIIGSNNPFDYPTIDAGYLSDPSNLDQQMLRSGFQAARRIGQTAPLKSMLGSESTPGTNVQSDDDWNTFIAQNAGTEYHPSSTCAMLPKNLGGVIDEDLLVYGTSNLRVADASIPPISMSMHFMTLTYGLAEAAADVIKFHRKGLSFPSGKPLNATSSSTSSPSSSSDGSRSPSAAGGGATTSAGGSGNSGKVQSSSSAAVRPAWASMTTVVAAALGVFVGTLA